MTKSDRQVIRKTIEVITRHRFWSAVASATATWVIIYITLNRCLTWELFVIYLVSVGGFTQLNAWLTVKYGDKMPPIMTSNTSSRQTVETETKSEDAAGVKTANETRVKTETETETGE